MTRTSRPSPHKVAPYARLGLVLALLGCYVYGLGAHYLTVEAIGDALAARPAAGDEVAAQLQGLPWVALPMALFAALAHILAPAALLVLEGRRFVRAVLPRRTRREV